jgi:hypothetical protein
MTIPSDVKEEAQDENKLSLSQKTEQHMDVKSFMKDTQQDTPKDAVVYSQKPDTDQEPKRAVKNVKLSLSQQCLDAKALEDRYKMIQKQSNV